MSTEQIAKFFEIIKTNVELQEEIKSAATAAAVADIAKKMGLDVTAADVLRSQAKATAELSDSELERISGGAIYVNYTIRLIAHWLIPAAVVGGITYGVNEINKN